MKSKICECGLPGKRVVSSPIDEVDTCQTCGGMIIRRFLAKVGTYSTEMIFITSGDPYLGNRIQFKRSDGSLSEGIVTHIHLGVIFIELM